MSLTTAQSTTYQRIRNSSTSKQAVRLSDDALRALVYITARDLDVMDELPEPSREIPDLFDADLTADYEFSGEDPKRLFATLCGLRADADTYVACLASLHKARLKYRKVLATQPFADMNQVGPRGLLQYGLVEVPALATLLIWRKWMYDVDNRAAQDTGYLVEPVIAGALGGTPYAARNSPIRRVSDPRKGRQVDCIKDADAYEFKLRMTIAASGQGRWSEELEYAEDCRASGYTPVLVVLDPTDSNKLAQLKVSFERAGGRCYIGDEAWQHLYEQASSDMVAFLRRYVEGPLRALFDASPPGETLPRLELRDTGNSIAVTVGDTTWEIPREQPDPTLVLFDDVPEDASENLPGVD